MIIDTGTDAARSEGDILFVEQKEENYDCLEQGKTKTKTNQGLYALKI